MTRGTWLIGAAGALALGLMAASVQAAPVIGAATGYKAVVGESSTVRDVHWGRRHHRHYYNYGYFAAPYPYWRYYAGPRYYYGYVPSVRLYYGPRHHHHHHWRRWW